jgi:hypothetical protein
LNFSETSALLHLNLGDNKVVGDGVEIVKGLPSSLQFFNISHNDLRGDIGYFISNVSLETDVIDLYVTESGLTGTACPGLTEAECPFPPAAGLFRDIAWQTQEMGTLIMRKSGSGNITLESTKLKLSDVEYDTPNRLLGIDKFRYDGWWSHVDMSGYCEKREQTTSEPVPLAGAFGSADDRLVFRTAEPDDKYLVFCPVQADEELLNWHGQPRVTRAGKGIEVDSIYSKVYDLVSFSYEPESRTGVAEDFPTKQFISYDMDVTNKCGDSVCAFYDQSVSWPSHRPQQLQPFKNRTDSATFGGLGEWQYNNSSDGVQWERRPFWQIERGKDPPGYWDKELVNSLCVIDLDEVWKCENKLLRGSGNEAISAEVEIVLKGTFMANKIPQPGEMGETQRRDIKGLEA